MGVLVKFVWTPSHLSLTRAFNILKRNTKIMGLDFGERRIGVALSDTDKSLAAPYLTIDCLKKDVVQSLATVLKEHPVDTIVIGYPLRTDDLPSLKVEAVEAFIADVLMPFNLPVVREDERYSTVKAQEILKSKSKTALKSKKQKNEIDRTAAAIILQNYINKLSRQA